MLGVPVYTLYFQRVKRGYLLGIFQDAEHIDDRCTGVYSYFQMVKMYVRVQYLVLIKD